jgi:hypothetical protein
MRNLLIATLVGVTAISAGCNKDDDKSQGGGSTQGTSSTSGSPQANPVPATAGQHNRLPLGEKTVGALKLVATMDAPVKPGGEGAFDVVITGGKPKAVRFWVGTETAEGSVKAKADEETTDNWHTHAEVPAQLPPGSKFWVEVEPPAGETFKASFDLKVE